MFLPYALKSGSITRYHLSIHLKVRDLIKKYAEKTVSEEIEPTCHDICTYLESQISVVKHVRGWFYQKGIDHSWLEFRDSPVIIDAYPVAGVYATIVTTEGLLNPWSRLYIPKDKEQDNFSESSNP